MSAFDLLLNPFAIVYCLIMGVLLYGLIYGMRLLFGWIMEEPATISVRPYDEQDVEQRMTAIQRRIESLEELGGGCSGDKLCEIEECLGSCRVFAQRYDEASPAAKEEINIIVQIVLDSMERDLDEIEQRQEVWR